MATFFEAHRATLERAVQAARERGYWSAYPETASGKIYGESAREDGEKAFEALIGTTFDLGGAAAGQVGKEVSPFGRKLDITYPAPEVEALIAAAEAAGRKWANASIEERVGVALETLARINKQSFLIANAVMHTSGQAFGMAFQAGGPHAQDRGLEAVAYAYEEMTRVPAAARWEKPTGKAPLVLDKTYRIIPRGIGLVIGCATFPTWNSYPGLFASLVTGNAVIVKPHPLAILPLAITIRICREVLSAAGFDPNVLQLAPDEPQAPITKSLALHPAIGIIDFTGSPAFGRWLRENAKAELYTEEAGVNPVVIDSTSDFKGMCQNLAFSFSLYSGQMCTAPQNVFVPASGVETNEGRKGFDDVAQGIAKAMDGLLGDAQRAAAILGAVQSEATLERVSQARQLGRVIRESTPVEGMPGARSASPVLIALDAGEHEGIYLEEHFGPIGFVIATADTADSIARAAASVRERGAITASLYTTDDGVAERAADALGSAGVSLSVNLTGGIYVNQSAAFSDFHVTGANPAGNASLTDSAFVANRFRVAMVRKPAAA